MVDHIDMMFAVGLIALLAVLILGFIFDWKW